MIKQLKDGCTVRGELQNIAHLETETIIGLGRIFYLKCICGNINAIYSGQHDTKCGENRECKIFDVNTQCAGGRSVIIFKEKCSRFLCRNFKY